MNATQLLAHFDRLAEAPNAVPRLRRFILDLAVRGKLVEQDAGDEPAAELLKRIQTERLRALNKSVKSGVAPGTEPESTDIQLPVGWAWSKLGDICTKTGSGSTPAGGKDAYVASGVPFLRSQNIYNDGLRLDGVAYISDATQARMSSTTVKAGDLLLNITGGSIGRCAIVPGSFVIGNINQHVAIIRLALLESGRFLHSVICSDYCQKHIFGNQTGAGREGLPKNRMDEIVIPVAPLAEQHRIVAKVDELMALCDQLEAAQHERERRRERLAAASLQRLNQTAADTTPVAQREHASFHLHHLPRLTTRPEHIKAMRQAILSLAVCGKLVKQDAKEGSAAELLKVIRAARLRVLSKTTKSSLATGTDPYSSDIELPFGWAWSKLGDLCVKTGSGSTPAGGKDAYVGSGVPFLRSQNVYDDGLRLEGVAYISNATQERMNSTTVKAGDLLLNITGGSIGRCAVVPESFVIGNINQHVAIIRMALLEGGRFLHTVIRSNYFQQQIVGGQTGAGREGLPKKRMDEILVPIAPLAEQRRIIAKVDELMALCDQLETQLTTTQTDSCRLLAAVLEAALVPA